MSTAAERRAARRHWTTTVFRDFAQADAADVAFWLSLPVEARVDLVARLSHDAGLGHRVPAKLGDHECFVISPEDMLTKKRAAGRPKDLVAHRVRSGDALSL